MNVNQIIKELELLPHPEGGYYKETYRSEVSIKKDDLPHSFSGARSLSTTIYFLIESGNFSAFHKIKSDEIWHFYAGDALEVIEMDETGKVKLTAVGSKMNEAEVFQYVVKANTWFGSRVKASGKFSLVGCTVSPGFDFLDFEMAKREDLLEKFPQHKRIIEEMTRI
jgi:predicted cupin superfamily sugar epimerase